MKQTTLLFLSVLFCAQTLLAQLSVSVSGGANLSSNSNSICANCKKTPMLNYFFEVRPNYNLGKRLNLGLGLQYSVKGYAIEYLGYSHDKVRVSYIDMIPQVSYKVAKFLDIYAGFNAGIKVSERFLYNDKWEKGIINFFNPVDAGALIGLRVPYKNMFFSAHYNHGIVSSSSIEFTDENGNLLENTPWYNQNLQIGVGYRFNIKKKI